MADTTIENQNSIHTELPEPPAGFAYESIDDSELGEEIPLSVADEPLGETQKRDLLGLVHDNTVNSAELARIILDSKHFADPQVNELVRKTFKDLECAADHAVDALKLLGWDADSEER